MAYDPKLYKACREGDMKRVRSTLAAIAKEPNADIRAKLQQKLGIYGYTPLHESATEGHHEVLRYLIEQGGNVDAKASNGYTPLHLAASGGHVECVKVLLEHGANINEPDDFRKTPINTAELGARMGVVKVLKSAGTCTGTTQLGDEAYKGPVFHAACLHCCSSLLSRVRWPSHFSCVCIAYNIITCLSLVMYAQSISS